MSANVNCLKGLRCPACGNTGPFEITGTAVFTVHDDGIGDYRLPEWFDDSFCACPQCDYDGAVNDFQAEAQP